MHDYETHKISVSWRARSLYAAVRPQGAGVGAKRPAYDRKLEKKMKRLSATELSELLSGEAEKPIDPDDEKD